MLNDTTNIFVLHTRMWYLHLVNPIEHVSLYLYTVFSFSYPRFIFSIDIQTSFYNWSSN